RRSNKPVRAQPLRPPTCTATRTTSPGDSHGRLLRGRDPGADASPHRTVRRAIPGGGVPPAARGPATEGAGSPPAAIAARRTHPSPDGERAGASREERPPTGTRVPQGSAVARAGGRTGATGDALAPSLAASAAGVRGAE